MTPKVYKSNKYCSLKLSIPIIHIRISNPICSLREKISTNNHVVQMGQNLVSLHVRQNSWIISLKLQHLVPNGLLLKLVTNSNCIKKVICIKSLLITNIHNNLGDSVAEGRVSEPTMLLSTMTWTCSLNKASPVTFQNLLKMDYCR